MKNDALVLPLISFAHLSFVPGTKDAFLRLVNIQDTNLHRTNKPFHPEYLRSMECLKHSYRLIQLGCKGNSLEYFQVSIRDGKRYIYADERNSGPSGPFCFEVIPTFFVNHFNLKLIEWKKGDILTPKFYWPLDKRLNKNSIINH